MISAVEILRLSGLEGPEAVETASKLLGDRSRSDLSRLLVLDDTAALTDHADAFERLLTSRRLDHLLCLAVGPRSGDTKAFVLPGSISSGRGSAVLWVSDPLGVDWQLAASAIANVRDSATNGLNRLVELLSTAEVFDRVCELAVRVPGGIASPGLRLAGTDSEAVTFTAALAVAIGRLTGSRPGGHEGADEPFVILRNAPAEVGLAEGGELGRHRDDVSASVAVAADALAGLASLSGLLGFSQPQAREQVIAAGTALGAFRDQVSKLLRNAHAPGGPNERQLAQLSRAGVRLPPQEPSPADSGDKAGAPAQEPGSTAVFKAIAEAIRAGDTLPRVASRLSRTERELDLRGSASYLPEVDRCCPAEVVRRLTEPALPPPAPSWLPAVGALAAALAGLAAGWSVIAGIIAGVIIAVGWAGIMVLTARAARGSSGSGGGTGSAGSAGSGGALLAAAALAGAAAGAGAGIALKTTRVAALACIALALVIVVAVAIWSWRARVRAWRRELALDDAISGAAELANLVTTVAAREWSGGAAALGEIGRARIIIDGVAKQLREYADGVGEVESAGPRASRVARLADSLTPALRELVLAVLAAQIAASGLDGRASFEQAQAKTGELITGWTQHVREHGALSPPPFAAVSINGTPYADDAEIAEIKEVVTHDPRAVMWQLCATTDLGALDVVGPPQVVAFAPRLARQPLADVLPQDTVWTSAGQHAGLLRLVALRAGIARPNWSDEAEDGQEPPYE